MLLLVEMFLTHLPFAVALIVACQALSYTDLGRRDSCETPRLSFCAGLVNYKVPTSIARLSEYIEFLLEQYSPALSGNEMDCTEPARRALCRQVFPACSEEKNTVTFEPYTDCASRLMAGCSANTLENINSTVICSSRTFDLVGQPCRSLTSSDAQNLGRCTLPLSTIGSMTVSDWMLHHIVVIGAFVVVDSLPDVRDCFATHWRYLCSFGECYGDRIHTRISEEECNSVMNW